MTARTTKQKRSNVDGRMLFMVAVAAVAAAAAGLWVSAGPKLERIIINTAD